MKAFLLLIPLLWLFGIVSWCVNIVKLTQADFEPPYKEEVLRAVSVPVAPLSLYVAWADFDEE